MTLRTRVTLAAGLAVLLAVAAVSVVVYAVVRANLYGQVDDSLRHSDPVSVSDDAHTIPDDRAMAQHVPLLRDAFLQLVDEDGRVSASFDDRRLPVTTEVIEVARGERVDAFFDADVDGTPVRIYAVSAGDEGALQVGRSLAEVQRALRQLVWALVAISTGAVVVAVVTGRLVAAAAVAPVHRVAEAADTVARTGELSVHLDVPGGELGRLAASFNTMLDALDESLARQRQLVADASHELRTPLATVRTNVEVLARADELPPGDRAALIGETVAQIAELTRLVGDLVELARGDGHQEPFTRVELDTVVREAVDSVGRSHPAVRFRVDATPSAVRGAPDRVYRAVSNLVDNAGKWSPPGAEVVVTVHNGTVTVADGGPGVDAADLPHIFDRVYRSAEARTMPGSGLGLAIVKQVADSHGGSVTVASAPAGGGLFTLWLPPESSATRTGSAHEA